MNAIEYALDNKALSRAEGAGFYRYAVRRPQLLLRALASSAAVLVAVIPIGATLLSAPVSARVGIVSIGYMPAR